MSKLRAESFTVSLNAAWSCETPHDEMLALKELLAFHHDRVDSVAVG
jgi:uncharacterized protein (DUF427 family)